MQNCFSRKTMDDLHAMNAKAATAEKTEASDDNNDEGKQFEENHLNWLYMCVLPKTLDGGSIFL